MIFPLLVDYDMKTWNVTARNKVEWGEGDYGDEWEPQSRDKILYLGREEDDEVEWTLTKKIPVSEVDKEIPAYGK